jgi:hypothetical protein
VVAGCGLRVAGRSEIRSDLSFRYSDNVLYISDPVRKGQVLKLRCVRVFVLRTCCAASDAWCAWRGAVCGVWRDLLYAWHLRWYGVL